jgi:hypothetical protein
VKNDQVYEVLEEDHDPRGPRRHERHSLGIVIQARVVANTALVTVKCARGKTFTITADDNRGVIGQRQSQPGNFLPEAVKKGDGLT